MPGDVPHLAGNGKRLEGRKCLLSRTIDGDKMHQTQPSFGRTHTGPVSYGSHRFHVFADKRYQNYSGASSHTGYQRQAIYSRFKIANRNIEKIHLGQLHMKLLQVLESKRSYPVNSLWWSTRIMIPYRPAYNINQLPRVTKQKKWKLNTSQV